MEGAELDGDASSDSDQGRERTFIKGERSFFSVDLLSGDKGVGVLGCGLKTDFDDVERLA